MGFKELFDKVADLIKIKLRYWVAVSGVLLLAVLLPTSATDKLGLTDLMNEHRLKIGAALAVAVGGTITQGFVFCVGLIERRLMMRKRWVAILDRLAKLTPEEKQILCMYVLQDSRTQYLAVQDGVPAGLEGVGILYRAAGAGNLYGKGFAFNINSRVFDHLKSNPALITEGVPLDGQGRVIGYRNPFNMFDM